MDLGHDIVPQVEGGFLQIFGDLTGKGGKSTVQRCAVGAGLDMSGEIRFLPGAEITVHHAADQLLIEFTLAHRTSLPLGFLDAMESGMFPSFSKKAQSFFRARKMRDFTVPSSSPMASPISS